MGGPMRRSDYSGLFFCDRYGVRVRVRYAFLDLGHQKGQYRHIKREIYIYISILSFRAGLLRPWSFLLTVTLIFPGDIDVSIVWLHSYSNFPFLIHSPQPRPSQDNTKILVRVVLLCCVGAR